jgi:hypothetical protein
MKKRKIKELWIADLISVFIIPKNKESCISISGFSISDWGFTQLSFRGTRNLVF